MSKKTFFIMLGVSLWLLLPDVSIAEGVNLGILAPYFKVKSGDDKTLTLDMIKGKVIVMFYETKDVVRRNRELKEELNKFYSNQPDEVKEFIVKLPVINCSSAFWPFTEIWKRKLRENSKRKGITIYGDWDGKMFSDYKMKDNESNVLIIDKKGIIRYITSGKVEDMEINKIKELLKEIENER